MLKETAVSNVRYLFDGFPPLPPPSPEGRTIPCPHCQGLCAEPESPDFISVVGCGGFTPDTFRP